MTHDGQPGRFPPPPPQKKPTGNRRNGWLYIGVGVIFLLLGGVGLLGDDAGALDWAFLVLGMANAVMGIMALTKADPTIDPFTTEG